MASVVAAGKPSLRRRIWLCADDYGISAAVNTAIRDLIVRGRINATSVMVVAPSFNRSEAIALSILNAGDPRVAIGLHLTLTAPFRPLSGFKPVNEGAFLPLETTLRRSMLRLISRKRVAIEVASQLKAFVTAFGQPPDFVDGHQHAHLFPQVREAFLDVVKKKAPQAWVRQCGGVPSRRVSVWDYKTRILGGLSRRFRELAAAHGVATNPAFAGAYDFASAGAGDFPRLFPQFLEKMPEQGVVMCHPGFVDAELRRLDPLTGQREREYAYLAGDEFPAALRAHGLTLA